MLPPVTSNTTITLVDEHDDLISKDWYEYDDWVTTAFEQSFLQKSGHDDDGDDVGIAPIKYYDVEPGKDFERW